MDFSLIVSIFPLLLKATVVTVEISALSIVLGVSVAILLIILKMARIAPFRWFATAYISIVRGTPFFVQLLLLYYGGPSFGLQLDPFTAGVICIGFNIGAYMAEAIRGALIAVDKGQDEAARSLGFGAFETLRYVIFPQAAGLMIRSAGNLSVILIKSSSLVSIISVVELTYQAQRLIGSTYKPFEVFLLAAALYMTIIYVVMRLIDLAYRRSTRYLNS